MSEANPKRVRMRRLLIGVPETTCDMTIFSKFRLTLPLTPLLWSVPRVRLKSDPIRNAIFIAHDAGALCDARAAAYNLRSVHSLHSFH